MSMSLRDGHVFIEKVEGLKSLEEYRQQVICFSIMINSSSHVNFLTDRYTFVEKGQRVQTVESAVGEQASFWYPSVLFAPYQCLHEVKMLSQRKGRSLRVVESAVDTIYSRCTAINWMII